MCLVNYRPEQKYSCTQKGFPIYVWLSLFFPSFLPPSFLSSTFTSHLWSIPFNWELLSILLISSSTSMPLKQRKFNIPYFPNASHLSLLQHLTLSDINFFIKLLFFCAWASFPLEIEIHECWDLIYLVLKYIYTHHLEEFLMHSRHLMNTCCHFGYYSLWILSIAV